METPHHWQPVKPTACTWSQDSVVDSTSTCLRSKHHQHHQRHHSCNQSPIQRAPSTLPAPSFLQPVCSQHSTQHSTQTAHQAQYNQLVRGTVENQVGYDTASIAEDFWFSLAAPLAILVIWTTDDLYFPRPGGKDIPGDSSRASLANSHAKQ